MEFTDRSRSSSLSRSVSTATSSSTSYSYQRSNTRYSVFCCNGNDIVVKTPSCLYFPAFRWVLEKWLAGKSCLSLSQSCLVSVRLSVRSRSQRRVLGQWYGTPVKSKYAARHKNRVAAGAENIVYPAESWAPRGCAHELGRELVKQRCLALA